jgi:hypothetical protein
MVGACCRAQKSSALRLDHITKDDIDVLAFHVPAPSINCALRTLRRMLHKAEEWNLLIKVPRFKLRPEHGRKLRLDDEAEQRLLLAATSFNWKPAGFDLFRDVIILARDTGMRNGRELYVNAVTTAGSFNVDYVNGTWAEGTITSDLAPALGATIVSSVPITAADKNQYILINLTPAVQAWLNGSEANDGIALVANSTFNASFDS